MSKYRYEIWKNILTKLEIGEEYSVDNTRSDYDQFVDALKTFAANWWNFIVKDHGESITFVMLDPVRCAQEMIDLYEEKGPQKPEEVKRDDFYTKSCNPENLEAQRKYWDASSEQERLTGGASGRRTNDIPQSGTLGHQEKDSVSTGLKTSRKENGKETEW